VFCWLEKTSLGARQAKAAVTRGDGDSPGGLE
jgi:hypothetical protein